MRLEVVIRTFSREGADGTPTVREFGRDEAGSLVERTGGLTFR